MRTIEDVVTDIKLGLFCNTSEVKGIGINDLCDEILEIRENEKAMQKTGHWYKKELPNGHWKCSCSECDYHGRFEWISCPNCGAKMESVIFLWNRSKQNE